MDRILRYLSQLERNNDRDWFHAHKEEYRQACGDFEAFLGRLIPALCAQDPSIPPVDPRDLTFKLNRDTRFSRDKSPYNPAFRAHIGPMGKLPIPVGYYIMIKPGGSFLGGGLFADMFKDATARIRDAIAGNGAQWEAILADPAFRSRFTLGGEALKNVPRGYDPGHAQAEYLKYKSWYLEYPVADEALLEEGFCSAAVETFAAMAPFNAFLNRALEGFEMPKR